MFIYIIDAFSIIEYYRHVWTIIASGPVPVFAPDSELWVLKLFEAVSIPNTSEWHIGGLLEDEG